MRPRAAVAREIAQIVGAYAWNWTAKDEERATRSIDRILRKRELELKGES